MAAHEQWYLTCDGCGEVLTEDGVTVCAETEECARSEAVELGWLCNTTTHEQEPDYCPDCVPQSQPPEGE